jgi:hypothetical protein
VPVRAVSRRPTRLGHAPIPSARSRIIRPCERNSAGEKRSVSNAERMGRYSSVRGTAAVLIKSSVRRTARARKHLASPGRAGAHTCPWPIALAVAATLAVLLTLVTLPATASATTPPLGLPDNPAVAVPTAQAAVAQPTGTARTMPASPTSATAGAVAIVQTPSGTSGAVEKQASSAPTAPVGSPASLPAQSGTGVAVQAPSGQSAGIGQAPGVGSAAPPSMTPPAKATTAAAVAVQAPSGVSAGVGSAAPSLVTTSAKATTGAAVAVQASSGVSAGIGQAAPPSMTPPANGLTGSVETQVAPTAVVQAPSGAKAAVGQATSVSLTSAKGTTAVKEQLGAGAAVQLPGAQPIDIATPTSISATIGVKTDAAGKAVPEIKSSAGVTASASVSVTTPSEIAIAKTETNRDVGLQLKDAGNAKAENAGISVDVSVSVSAPLSARTTVSSAFGDQKAGGNVASSVNSVVTGAPTITTDFEHGTDALAAVVEMQLPRRETRTAALPAIAVRAREGRTPVGATPVSTAPNRIDATSVGSDGVHGGQAASSPGSISFDEVLPAIAVTPGRDTDHGMPLPPTTFLERVDRVPPTLEGTQAGVDAPALLPRTVSSNDVLTWSNSTKSFLRLARVQGRTPWDVAAVSTSPRSPVVPDPRQAQPAAPAGAGPPPGFGFGMFAVLMTLMILASPRLGRRLQLRAAVWRPVAFVAPLERPG